MPCGCGLSHVCIRLFAGASCACATAREVIKRDFWSGVIRVSAGPPRLHRAAGKHDPGPLMICTDFVFMILL